MTHFSIDDPGADDVVVTSSSSRLELLLYFLEFLIIFKYL
jgi:hypothetical protein